ncbi:MAG TPA: helix-turn-helix domain-containing protein [Candidatus Butyricicoccus avicola]|nr:helix-turn-helix domain-containing protein [Candidatus Butyricicoccus avicola]
MMYNVMLVDKEPAVLGALARSIDWAAQGCRIAATAQDGREAVAQFGREAPDIVISDIRIPEMDGLALARWIAGHHPSCKVILLSGLAETNPAPQAAAGQVVDFVRPPAQADKLIVALQAAKARLAEDGPKRRTGGAEIARKRESFLHQMIFTPGQSLLYAMQLTQDLGLDLSGFYVLCLGVEDAHTAADRLIFSQDAQQLWRRVLDGHTVYFVPRTEPSCYLVLCAGAPFDPAGACEQVVQAARQAGFQATVGVSAHHSGPFELADAAREAARAQQRAAHSPHMPVMTFGQLPSLSASHAARITEALHLIQSALENRNHSTALLCLDRLFAYLRREAIPFSCAERIAVILYECGQALLIRYSLESLLSGPLPAGTAVPPAGGTLDEIEAQTAAYLAAVLDRICTNATGLDDLVFRVKQYIDQNYASALSLEGLASYVHLSSSYLSKLFKRELGQNISSYIQHVRIERAKVLLRTTSKKTYEIAEAVGIPDPVYFSKIFKRATGQKPKDFRAADPL